MAISVENRGSGGGGLISIGFRCFEPSSIDFLEDVFRWF